MRKLVTKYSFESIADIKNQLGFDPTKMIHDLANVQPMPDVKLIDIFKTKENNNEV